ncbi:MAG: hypothetical protein WD355_07560 [Balneolaceae bacterium]
MTDYIAVLDHNHLDNGLFLTAFAKSAAAQKGQRGIVIHGESDYTERLIQTGIMREEARIRAIKDLNHRLIALFADEGVATVGVHGFQRGLITESNGDLDVDVSQLRSMPDVPLLLLSNLIQSSGDKPPSPLSLPAYAFLLRDKLDIDEVLIFSMDDSDEILDRGSHDELRFSELDTEYKERVIPPEFRDAGQPFRITTARAFSSWPGLQGTTLIRP